MQLKNIDEIAFDKRELELLRETLREAEKYIYNLRSYENERFPGDNEKLDLIARICKLIDRCDYAREN